MLSRWISATDAAPTPMRTTRVRMSVASSSRCGRVSILESFTARMSFVSGVTRHAAATTGPASAAIPTSSTPTTRGSPLSQSCFSNFSVGTHTGCHGRAGQVLAALLPERGRLADALAQEVERGAPGVTVTGDLDLVHPRRVDEERTLDAHARRDAPDGDLLVEPTVAHA